MIKEMSMAIAAFRRSSCSSDSTPVCPRALPVAVSQTIQTTRYLAVAEEAFKFRLYKNDQMICLECQPGMNTIYSLNICS